MAEQINDTEGDWAAKMDTARASFRDVLASDEHEDGKAQRILTAMAFLTAAAGFIFGNVNDVDSLTFPAINSLNFVSFSFFLFVGTMIAGTLFMLAALGPVFNIPPRWSIKTGNYPKSLLFSQLIIAELSEQWISHWTSSSADNLKAELAQNYAAEAYLISEKVVFKVGSMKLGKIFYKAAFGFLGMLIIPVFTTDERIVYSVSAWLISAVVLQELMERMTSPPVWKLEQWKNFLSRAFWKRNLLSVNLWIGPALFVLFAYLLVKGFDIYF